MFPDRIFNQVACSRIYRTEHFTELVDQFCAAKRILMHRTMQLSHWNVSPWKTHPGPAQSFRFIAKFLPVSLHRSDLDPASRQTNKSNFRNWVRRANSRHLHEIFKKAGSRCNAALYLHECIYSLRKFSKLPPFYLALAAISTTHDTPCSLSDKLLKINLFHFRRTVPRLS